MYTRDALCDNHMLQYCTSYPVEGSEDGEESEDCDLSLPDDTEMSGSKMGMNR